MSQSLLDDLLETILVGQVELMKGIGPIGLRRIADILCEVEDEAEASEKIRRIILEA